MLVDILFISMELRLVQATETIFLEQSYKEILSF